MSFVKIFGEVCCSVHFSKMSTDEDAAMKQLIAMLLEDKRKIQQQKKIEELQKHVVSTNPPVIVQGQPIWITKIDDGKQEAEEDSDDSLEEEPPKYKRMNQTEAYLNVRGYIMGYSGEDKADVEEIEGRTRGDLMGKIDEKFDLLFKFVAGGSGLHIRQVRGLWAGFYPDPYYPKYSSVFYSMTMTRRLMLSVSGKPSQLLSQITKLRIFLFCCLHQMIRCMLCSSRDLTR